MGGWSVVGSFVECVACVPPLVPALSPLFSSLPSWVLDPLQLSVQLPQRGAVTCAQPSRSPPGRSADSVPACDSRRSLTDKGNARSS